MIKEMHAPVYRRTEYQHPKNVTAAEDEPRFHGLRLAFAFSHLMPE